MPGSKISVCYSGLATPSTDIATQSATALRSHEMASPSSSVPHRQAFLKNLNVLRSPRPVSADLRSAEHLADFTNYADNGFYCSAPRRPMFSRAGSWETRS
jgi:hypothetical protein